jgi:amino acid transporter
VCQASCSPQCAAEASAHRLRIKWAIYSQIYNPFPMARPLLRILGLGFGLALVFGGTVGVGILRLPGTVAAALGNSHLIVLFWVLGGVYALLGAVAVAELAAMAPQAGGFYVYAQRAFGNGFGFVIGWSDWINNVAALALQSITAAAFLGALWAPATAHPQAVAISLLAAFTGSHWVGLRICSTLTGLISVSVGVMLLVLVAGCFLVAPVAASSAPPLATTAASLPFMSMAMLAAVVSALRAVLLTFDGWYSPGGRVHQLDAHRAASHHWRDTAGRCAVRRDQPCVPPHSAAPSVGRLGTASRQCGTCRTAPWRR